MFARGPTPGTSPKADAMKVLPVGVKCELRTALGITGYVVSLPDGRKIASAGTPSEAWSKAAGWADRERESIAELAPKTV